MKIQLCTVAVLACALSMGGCAGDEIGSDDYDFTSAEATLLDFELDGELLTTSGRNPLEKVQAQLLYTVGHFNQEHSVSQLNAVEITNVEASWIGGGLRRIRYHAKLPVAWNDMNGTPAQYTLTLPKRVDAAGQATFQSAYGSTCTDHHGHTLTSANFWYYYRPGEPGCSFEPDDVTVSVATVTKSALNSVDAYPEYHRIWEDGALDVVAVFGKAQRDATAIDAAGIAAYDDFVAEVRERFPGAITTPADLPYEPGNAVRDITFEAKTEAGRVSIVVLLVDEVKSAPESFDKRFSEATPGADLVLYGGHAGLGSNARALTEKAKWFPGKYQILFLDGCDTLAYETDALVEARAALNPNDPTGTKYLDVMHNAMPAYFHELAPAAMAIIDAALEPDSPKSYETIFEAIDPRQVVVVTGDEDNTFHPDLPLETTWMVMSESGSVDYDESESYQTEVLPAGNYVFELTPEPATPGGDADLFLAVDEWPTTTTAHKCQSYRYNTNERCLLTLEEPATVFLITQGDKDGESPYRLRAWERID